MGHFTLVFRRASEEVVRLMVEDNLSSVMFDSRLKIGLAARECRFSNELYILKKKIVSTACTGKSRLACRGRRNMFIDDSRDHGVDSMEEL